MMIKRRKEERRTRLCLHIYVQDEKRKKERRERNRLQEHMILCVNANYNIDHIKNHDDEIMTLENDYYFP